MEKLDKIKETYAKELGYKDWETCINDQPNYKVEILMNEVALRLHSVIDRYKQQPNKIEKAACKKGLKDAKSKLTMPDVLPLLDKIGNCFNDYKEENLKNTDDLSEAVELMEGIVDDNSMYIRRY